MKSLMIVGLPRSLSSWIYQVCREATGLREPSWTSDGEVLNLDRYRLRGGDRQDSAFKFLHASQAPADYAGARDLLGALVHPRGHIYKDVVQPFVLAEWGAKNAGRCHLVRIERPLADIAWAMWRRRWTYPAYALAPSGLGERVDFLRGLVAAEAALRTLDIPFLQFDQLIFDLSPLATLLNTWYPKAPLARLPAFDDFFARKRAETLERRRLPEYQAFAEELATV